jgi:phosphoribosyl-ATP pyrophosphohydrolase
MSFTLQDLEARVALRAKADPKDSWTAKLANRGMEQATKKLGEEAVETVIAALAQSKKATRDETADLLYHLLVVLHIKGVSVEDVMAELQKRTASSGLSEKAARKK